MKKKTALPILIVLIIALIASTLIAVAAVDFTIDGRRDRAQYLASSISAELQHNIASDLYLSRIWQIEIQNLGRVIDESNFEMISESVSEDYEDVEFIAIAPSGVITFCYPHNESYVGESVFNDEALAEVAKSSRANGQDVIALSSIFALEGEGLTVLYPIYKSEVASESNFWGFIVTVITLPDLYLNTSLGNLSEQGYEFQIDQLDSTTSNLHNIYHSSYSTLINPVESEIILPDGQTWILKIAAKGSWLEPEEFLFFILLAILISFLASMSAWGFMQMRRNNKQLEVMSYRDALTNLYNPRSYNEHLDELNKKKLPYGIIYIDLNDFKQVNDTYGHDTGDQLLNIIAKRLQNSIREKDRAFRIGGDEFTIVIHGAHDKSFYNNVISRMRDNVSRPITIGTTHIDASISAGFARYPEDGKNTEEIIQKADEAMYHNKRLIKARRFAEGKGTLGR